MINIDDPLVQLDDQLDKMAESLQLDASRQTRMESAYKAVHNFVKDDKVFFKDLVTEVYPQGSVRIGTTNKPAKGSEFDLDTVIQLKPEAAKFGANRIWRELERRLKESGVYMSRLEPKNRCMRVLYENDFHMDVLVACQQSWYCKNTILVPTKDRSSMQISNPRGHADWFIDKANRVDETLLEKSDRQRSVTLEKLPSDNFRRKKPLQRSVQLLKRYRDIFFAADDTYATSSIILTTIAGHYYQGEESIYSAMDGIINRIIFDANQGNGRIRVVNPVNSSEDFTSKWDNGSKYYLAFLRFANHLRTEWQKFKQQPSVITESQILKGLFGDDPFNAGSALRIEELKSLRESGQLRQDRKTGILTSSAVGSTLVKPNTFFGEQI